MTACFGRGCEALLAAFGDRDTARPASWRRGFLLGMVTAGLETLFPNAAERRAYLSYHRDWLIRSPVLERGSGPAAAAERLDHFDRAIAVRGLGDVKMEIAAARAAAADPGRALTAAWCAALGALHAHLCGAARLPVRDLDPFVEGPVFPALFKVFHGLANAAGLNSVQEARTYHYLLRAAGAAAASRPPALRPAASSPPAAAAYGEPARAALRAFDFEAEYRWDDLVAASGSEGVRWTTSYRQMGSVTWQVLQAALKSLRQRRFDDAWRLLTEAERCRAGLLAEPSQFHVLGRFYFGVLAYAYFCRQELDRADRALTAALDAVRQALEVEEVLLPFAAMATDMLIKRVHVERARCNWAAMDRAVQAMRAVAADRAPLVVLSGGRPVFHATIGAHLAGLIRPVQATERIARYLADAGLRQSQLELEVQSLYALPGFVIPYP
jgi:hypothetical protein